MTNKLIAVLCAVCLCGFQPSAFADDDNPLAKPNDNPLVKTTDDASSEKGADNPLEKDTPVEKDNPLEKEENPLEKDDPVVKKDEPTTEKVDPVVKKDEPTTKKVDPVVKKEEPTNKKVDPVAKMEEPTNKKVDPVVKNDPIMPEPFEPTVTLALPLKVKDFWGWHDEDHHTVAGIKFRTMYQMFDAEGLSDGFPHYPKLKQAMQEANNERSLRLSTQAKSIYTMRVPKGRGVILKLNNLANNSYGAVAVWHGEDGLKYCTVGTGEWQPVKTKFSTNKGWRWGKVIGSIKFWQVKGKDPKIGFSFDLREQPVQ